jgi:small-conductance mechanosensitive channel
MSMNSIQEMEEEIIATEARLMRMRSQLTEKKAATHAAAMAARPRLSAAQIAWLESIPEARGNMRQAYNEFAAVEIEMKRLKRKKTAIPAALEAKFAQRKAALEAARAAYAQIESMVSAQMSSEAYEDAGGGQGPGSTYMVTVNALANPYLEIPRLVKELKNPARWVRWEFDGRHLVASKEYRGYENYGWQVEIHFPVA